VIAEISKVSVVSEKLSVTGQTGRLQAGSSRAMVENEWSLTVTSCEGWESTLCLRKKVPTFKLSVTLSNHNRLSKFLHCWIAHEICYKPHVILSTSPSECCYTTSGNKKFRLSADVEEDANKLHF